MRWIVVLTLLLAGSPIIVASDGPPAGRAAADRALLHKLGSHDYAVRQRATDRLLRDHSVPLSHLDDLFKQARTPEQRQRLLTVIHHHFVRQMRQTKFHNETAAAVGFSHQVYQAGMAPGYEGAAVLVVRTLPGFPAYAYLHPGDLIVAVDGKPLPDATTSNTFKKLLRHWQAGDTLPLTVRRAGSRLRRDVPLAGFDALTQMYTNAARLNAPYQKRWLTYRRRLMDGLPAVPRLQPSAESP